MGNIVRISSAALIAAGLAIGVGAGAAELPKSTQKILAKLKLDASVLKGLDKELRMPAGLVEKARKEGKVLVYGTMDHEHWQEATGPFRERYPFVKVVYSRPKRNDRAMKPLIALKTGRYITDMIIGLGGKFFLYTKDNLVADLRDLPNYNNVIKGANDPAGLWAGTRVRLWCMAYNTKKVKPSELPAKWGDLLTMKRWWGDKIGMANRPNSVVLTLWGYHGEAWGRKFIDGLFNKVKPQLRKEGTNALIGLAVAGEFDASFPAAMHRTWDAKQSGAPINYHCPEPVSTSITEVILLKGSPRTHAAKMFVNWMLTKEYQIAQAAAAGAVPVHKDLQDPRFLKFADQIVGKPRALRKPELNQLLPVIYKQWNPLWEGGSGIVYRTVESKVLRLRRGGRVIDITAGGERHRVKVSGRRTKVTMNGKPADRSDIKPGMVCKVEYPGNKQEARSIACRK